VAELNKKRSISLPLGPHSLDGLVQLERNSRRTCSVCWFGTGE